MALLIGTSEGMFVADQAGAPGAGIGLNDRNVHVFRRANGSVLAGADDGVYRSNDDGGSWQGIGCEGEDIWAIAVSAANQHLIYAGVHPAGLFRSEDDGRSWSPVESLRGVPGADTWRLPSDPNGSRALAIVLDDARSEHLWVGVEVGGILETSDAGATWMLTLAGRNPDIHGLVRDSDRPDVLYAATGYGRLDPNDPEEPAGVYRSDDGGESWRYAWPDADRRWTRPMCIDARAPRSLTVASCPNFQSTMRNPGGAQSMLYQSTDGATTWRSLCDPAHTPSTVNITAVAVAERPGSVVVGMENGEVWEVSPEAAWTPMANGLPPVQALLSVG